MRCQTRTRPPPPAHRERRGDGAEPSTSPPLSSRHSQGLRPKSRPGRARPAISSPVIRSQPRSGLDLPPRPPKLRHGPLSHTRRPPPFASPGEKCPEALERGMRSARFLTSGWRRGTQPASVSYSSGPSAILVLNPSSRCMPGENVSPSRGSGEAEGEREGEREPGRRRRDRLRLLPLAPGRPSCPLPLGRRGSLRACAPAPEPGRPRARARAAALRRGWRAEGSGRGLRYSGAGPGPTERRGSGRREGAPGVTESLTWETQRRRGVRTALAAEAARCLQARCPAPVPPVPRPRDPGRTGHPAPATRFEDLRLESRRASL